MTPNPETEKCDFEHQTKGVALNAKLKAWLWRELTYLNVKLRRTTLNVKLRRNDDDSEPRNWKYDSEHQVENQWWLWTPKLRMRLWTSNWEVMIALNAETENATLNVKLGSDDSSERRNWECDSERQTEKWWWLWTPKLRMRWGWL